MKKILLIPLIILLTGCWNYNELNNLAICTGIAIDKNEENYEITFLISNEKKNESDEAKTTSYSGIGETIKEAIDDIKLKIPFRPYTGHLVVTVISEEVAKEGLENILDYLARDTESRNFFYILLSKNSKAKDILEIISPLQTFPTQTIASDINSTSTDSSLIYKTTYNDFIYTLLEQGIHPVLNSLTILENNEENLKETSDTPKKSIKIDTLGIFKEDKLIGWANKNQSEGINILSNNTDNIYIKTKCEDKYIMNHVKNIKTKTKIDLKNNKVKIKINGTSTISEINCKIDLENKETIKKLENDIKEELNKIIFETTKLIQNEYETDVLGYGKIIHKTNPKEWKKIKNNWDETFKNLKIETEININILNQGTLLQTIKETK